jgi:hypothetical protein
MSTSSTSSTSSTKVRKWLTSDFYLCLEEEHPEEFLPLPSQDELLEPDQLLQKTRDVTLGARRLIARAVTKAHFTVSSDKDSYLISGGSVMREDGRIHRRSLGRSLKRLVPTPDPILDFVLTLMSP